MDRQFPPPSNSVRMWMPLWIGDYLRDTIDLTKAQHGSYLLSIMAYWSKGEALSSEELRAITGKDVDRICRFFIWADNRWNHKRIDAELSKARENVRKQKEKSQKGVEARRAKGQLSATTG